MGDQRAAGMGYDELLQLVELIKGSSQFSEFRLRSGDLEIELRRGPASSSPAGGTPAPAAPPAASAPQAAAPQAAAPHAAAASAATSVVPPAPVQAPPSAPAAAHGSAPPADLPANAVVVRSPMVGTFYRSPEPGAPPFVEPGRRVAPDTTVCIVEVMKLMNSIPAGCAGTVERVLVDDATAVEYGQPLLVVVPDGR